MSIRIRVTRRRRAQLPLIRSIPRPVLDEIGQVAAGAIIDNVLQQRQADGTRLKTNAPSTRERKRREGKPLLSLVDELHRFIQKGVGSWGIVRYLPAGRGIVVGAMTEELRRLVRYVGAAGYTGFIGLRPKHRAAIGAVIRRWLSSLMRTSGGVGSRGGTVTRHGEL